MEFSIISSSYGVLTKKIGIQDGKITKDSKACWLKSGHVERVTADNLLDFKMVLDGLDHNQAITLGIVPNAEIGAPLLLSSKKQAKSNEITRTLEHFHMPTGECLVLLDYDPAKDREALSLTELDKELTDLIPEISGSERLILGSTSSGIVLPDGTKRTGGGAHVYLRLASGTLLPKFKELIWNRSWLTDHGYILISTSGALLPRSLFDGAVFSPERLIFEAPPILLNGLTRSDREYLHIPGESVIKLPDETDTERVDALIERAKARAKPESDTKLENFKKAKIKEMGPGKRSKSIETAVTRFVENDELSGAWPIVTAEYGRITASDILCHPDKYDDAECVSPDEDEPEKASFRAKIYVNEGGRVLINSFRHGGRLFKIKRQKIELKPDALFSTFAELDAALSTGNHPSIFSRNGELVLISDDGLITLTPANLPVYVGRLVTFYKRKTNRNGTWENVAVVPARDFWAAYAALGAWRLPRLSGLTAAPYFHNEVLRKTIGYDAETGLYLTQDHAIHLPNDIEIESVLNRLYKLLSGFPFAKEEHRAAVIAAMLTAVLRPLMPIAPLFGITAPCPGSGKSQLAGGIGIIATGCAPPMGAYSRDASEFRKLLTSILRESKSLYIFDNIGAGISFDSDVFCSLLTSGQYSDRALGANKTLNFSVVTTMFLATGNNLQLGTDLSRRAIMIEIDPKMSNPDERFFCQSFTEICHDKRREILEDLLSIAANYKKAGCPALEGLALGSFGDWCKLVRDPVLFATGFDVVRCKAPAVMNQDFALFDEFIGLWSENLGTESITLKEARRASDAIREFLDGEFSYNGQFQPSRAGRWLSSLEKRVSNGWRLVKAGTDHRAVKWRLECVVEPK